MRAASAIRIIARIVVVILTNMADASIIARDHHCVFGRICGVCPDPVQVLKACAWITTLNGFAYAVTVSVPARVLLQLNVVSPVALVMLVPLMPAFGPAVMLKLTATLGTA